MKISSKGFTLIELLIVIAIVSILSVVVLLTLNPAQLLKQARDSNRISDMSTYKSAIALYLADAISPSLDGGGQNCSAHVSSTLATCNTAPVAGEPARFNNSGAASSSATSTAVTGGGWIPIDFSSISSGSPISIEPIDPVNNPTYFYAYAGSSTLLYEVNTRMESAKFQSGGTNDVESTDGGSTANLFEIGIIPGLNL
jgi:prepilin-type N-terminal cleavage/methylation domain-containing protein